MNEPRVSSFSAVARPDARLLILGTMPGIASLEQAEYYAHPRNLFWDLMGEMVGFSRDIDYQQRLEMLAEAGLALWDVLASCRRKGSLDSSIETDTVITNDFATLFRQCTEIQCLFFNGQPAANLYRRFVLRDLSPEHQAIPRVTLPSTSPANASWSLERKREAWQQIKTFIR